jgi:hypothetical protein
MNPGDEVFSNSVRITFAKQCPLCRCRHLEDHLPSIWLRWIPLVRFYRCTYCKTGLMLVLVR